jgi:hypothetical protein
MDSLASVAELRARCDWDFDDNEDRAAAGYLEEASDLARTYGNAAWTLTTAPRMVKTIVISSVRRYMRNPEGFIQSRAGDETVIFADLGHDAGSIYFTPAEIKLIRGLSGGGLRTATVNAWGTSARASHSARVGNVPVAGWPGEKPFPYYADPESPW